MPTLFQRFSSVTDALVGWLTDGAKLTNAEEYEQRLSICQSCPDRDNEYCKLCGCFLPAKAAMKTTDCDAGRWPNV